MPQSYSDNEAVYSVDMMFAYLNNHKHPILKVNVNDYIDMLEYPSWGNPEKNIMYSAKDVLKNPEKYSNDYKRIINADLSYPIIISNNEIIDGIHRLTKAYLKNKKKIKAYIFSEELMKKFKLADKTENVWNKIDKLQMYEIISLFYERFCNKKIKGGTIDYFQKYKKYKIKYLNMKKN